MSLRDDLKAKSQRALNTMNEPPPAAPAGPRRAVTTPGAIAFMQPTIDALSERAESAEAEVVQLRKRLDQQPTEAALSQLVEVAGRKRKLTPEQFEELKENLRHNPLVHPVAVRRLSDGRFEIVSGHNRSDAYRALGRETIPIIVVDIEDALIDRSAFFANLMAPALPDFEKYMGFKRELARMSNGSQKQLAQESGVSESTISRLFSFEELPERARELIEDRPLGVGMNCAADLARASRNGHGERVVEAVELLLAGKLTQKEAVAYAERAAPKEAQPRPAPPAPVKIRAGRLEFCQYVAKGHTLRIDFKDESQRAAAEKRIAVLLKELAEASKLN